MKPVTTYIDYRVFLSDYYAEKKRTTRHFSHRYFAMKAGITSSSFLSRVIAGKRNLTGPMIEKFAKALNLGDKERTFFVHLVRFNQATTAKEKSEHYATMRMLSGAVHEKKLHADQYDYFSNWYTPVIRELICIHSFEDDYPALARMVIPAITAKQARDSVELIRRLGLVEKLDSGRYRQTDKSIAADPKITAIAVRAYADSMLEHARGALHSMSKDIRHISTMTLGVSRAQYEVLTQELGAFRERVKAIVTQDDSAEQVYELNFALFPVSSKVPSFTTGIRHESD